MAKPKKDILNLLKSKIQHEGFDYALIHWDSQWEDVKDQKFRELYDKFKKSRKEFVEFLETWGITDLY